MSRNYTTYSWIKRARWMTLLMSVLIGFALFTINEATADQIVFGSVSGRWVRDYSPYRVVDSIYIPEGEELIIEPGVQVLFEGLYRFTVLGLLRAEGGAEEANRIVFRNHRAPQWLGIEFHQEADARSRLVNCDIDSAWWGITINNHTGLLIQGCSIKALSIGIACDRSSPYINNNRLISATGANTLNSIIAISLVNSSNPQIVNNQCIYARANGGGEAYGIHSVRSSPLIYGNWIEVFSDVGATCIHIERTYKLLINRNIIRCYSPRSMRGLWISYASGISFDSNTLHLMATSLDAIGLFIFGSEIEIRNNIVIGNGSSVGDRTINGTILNNSGWNDYWLHSVNHLGGWNGGEGEINANPLFVNFTIESDADYHLTWESFPNLATKSPCIDAGCPNVSDEGDIYNTRSDIGRYPFIYDPNQTSVFKEEQIFVKFDWFGTYPNPFNSTSNIEFNLPKSGPIDIALFDTQGRFITTVYKGILDEGYHNLVWKPERLTAGGYIIKLKSDYCEKSQILIYNP